MAQTAFGKYIPIPTCLVDPDFRLREARAYISAVPTASETPGLDPELVRVWYANATYAAVRANENSRGESATFKVSEVGDYCL